MKNLVGLVVSLMRGEQEILEILATSENALNAREIARKTNNFSHPTVYEILKRFKRRGFVKSRTYGPTKKRTVWYLPPEIRNAFRKQIKEKK